MRTLKLTALFASSSNARSSLIAELARRGEDREALAVLFAITRGTWAGVHFTLAEQLEVVSILSEKRSRAALVFVRRLASCCVRERVGDDGEPAGRHVRFPHLSGDLALWLTTWAGPVPSRPGAAGGGLRGLALLPDDEIGTAIRTAVRRAAMKLSRRPSLRGKR